MSRRTLPLLALLLVPSLALACLWDHDTLKMERSRFPSALELITGKFLRHSPEFYAWRVTDRLAKLKLDPPNLALRDDLAVAYAKLGRFPEALTVLRESERTAPERYETASNLGTVLMLSGQWKEGLPHIEKAIRINPDAHFGREKYQKLIVEYALKRRPDGVLTFPLNKPADPENDLGFSMPFMAAVRKAERESYAPTLDEVTPAVTGVLGMM